MAEGSDWARDPPACGLPRLVKVRCMDQQLSLIIGLVVVAALIVVNTMRRTVRRKRVTEMLAEGAKIVDARSPSEFGSGHYPGAINIPLDKLPARMKKLGSRDSSIVVYCASGSRSRVVASHLRASGFTNVVNAGGLSSMPR